MHDLQTHIKNYLEYCNTQKCLDEKMLKAYRIDLRQFSEQLSIPDVTEITSSELETYIAGLHQKYKPKTAKRKIASVKALIHYLEYKEILQSPQALWHWRFPRMQVARQSGTRVQVSRCVHLLPRDVLTSLRRALISLLTVDLDTPIFSAIFANARCCCRPDWINFFYILSLNIFFISSCVSTL